MRSLSKTKLDSANCSFNAETRHCVDVIMYTATVSHYAHRPHTASLLSSAATPRLPFNGPFIIDGPPSSTLYDGSHRRLAFMILNLYRCSSYVCRNSRKTARLITQKQRQFCWSQWSGGVVVSVVRTTQKFAGSTPAATLSDNSCGRAAYIYPFAQ